MGRASGWPRIILHADMDAFFASVEQRDDPALRGRPVLVGGTGRRGVVSAASYEARPFGCHSAMPMEEARRRCPEAVVLAPRLAAYAAVSARIMDVFHDFSPLVEALSLDEAFLDMSGAEGLFGPPLQMAQRLKAAVREATGGLTVSVGAATTKFVAKLASDWDKPDGITLIPPDQVRARLDPLPVSKLWGVGDKTLPRLERLGLETIGDVARAPASALRSLGSLGDHIHRLARGIDTREVIPDRDRKSAGAEVTLEQDVVGAAAIRPHLRRSAERVARHLRAEGWLAGGVRVKLKTARFQIVTRQAPLPIPADGARALFEAADALLPTFDLSQPMRLIGVAAYDLKASDEPVQADLFGGGERESERRLDRTLDTLRARFGPGAIRRGVDLDERDE